jgi:hypothetical protein
LIAKGNFSLHNLLIYLNRHTKLLTYQLHPLDLFWEGNSLSSSQKIMCLLWNLKVHYHIHKSPLLKPILSQINFVHIFTRSFYVRFNIRLSSHLRLYLVPRSPPFMLFDQKVCAYLIFTMCVVYHTIPSSLLWSVQ